jgi:hypothetical protein
VAIGPKKMKKSLARGQMPLLAPWLVTMPSARINVERASNMLEETRLHQHDRRGELGHDDKSEWDGCVGKKSFGR